MSIVSALYAGASGVQAMSKSMQVISNNIANVNTVGFKGSRAEFADLLSQAINTPAGKKQVGRGVRVEAVQGLFHQGSFESTSVVTDVALNGGGYFVVTSGDETFYTRAGTFSINKDGDLVNSIGMNVNGYLYDASGLPTGVRGNINLSSQTADPNPTGDGIAEGTGVTMNVNLDSEAVLNDPPVPFSLSDPSGTSEFSTSFTVYDSLGAGHTCIVYFTKTGEVGDPAGSTANTWEWNAVVDGSEIVGGTAGDPEPVGSGTLEFDTNGVLLTSMSPPPTLTASFIGGADPSQVVGLDFDSSTQLASASVTNALTQDGYGPGALQAIDIDREGVITGVFSNGRARPLAALTVASFANENGLFRVGNSLFTESVESGQAVYAQANTGNNGTVAASTLELSNVDLSNEFITMITHQRGFQANTKIITAGDEMLETVINMKR